MRRHTLALLAGATLLIGSASTGTALAQETDPPTGPDTQACADARGALDDALVDVDAAVGLRGDANLDAISDRLAELEGTAGASAALALVGDARTACTPPAQDGGDGDQDDGGMETPAPAPTPVPGDDSDQNEGPQPGDDCTTDEIGSGIVGSDGECIGATGGPTTVQAPTGSGSDGDSTGGSPGGQVTTVPQGYADTGAL